MIVAGLWLHESVESPNEHASLSPRLTEVLGITAPVLQSGMGGVAGTELAAAVSNAGGLGTLAALRLKPDAVRAGIERMRLSTASPFAVNIWLHQDVRTTPDPATVAEDVVRGSQAVLNEYRGRFDLRPKLDRPARPDDLVNDALDVMIEERIPVFCAAIGVPEAELVERFQRAGTRVVSMVATIEDGRQAVANGVDVVVAQGTEAGGHRSYGTKRELADATGSSTLTLVPEMVDAVGGQVPVVAAGGIVDGRGLAAMLALGADGVLLGTRFVATRESQAAKVWKRRITTGDRSTTLTDGFTGQWARVLRSDFTDRWADASENENVVALPGLLQAAAGADLFGAAKAAEDDQLQPLYAGAAVGRLDDIPGAGEVVQRLVDEAREILNGV